jgi:putative transposase
MVSSQVGDVELAVPRDRNGSFPPQLVPKGSRRLGGLDEMIISLYAGGMTLRDIQYHLVSTIGTELSHESISKITDQVAEEALSWQRRPPVVSGDLSRRFGGQGQRRRPRTQQGRPPSVGVDVDGIKHVLGIWVQTSEGARFWARGVRRAGQPRHQRRADRLCDGLTGFPEAIEATWPNSTIQTCVVHLIRPAMRFVSWKDRRSRRRSAETDLPSRRRRRGTNRARGVQSLRVRPHEAPHRRCV